MVNFIIVVREYVPKTGVVLRTCIDATREGNIARFLNHSCSPNLISFCVRTGCPEPRLAFFAANNIAAGQELTISYGRSAGKRQVKGGTSKRPCFCGAISCSGSMPYDSDEGE
jgi:histone-lysine N-methyltransferase SETMAR